VRYVSLRATGEVTTTGGPSARTGYPGATNGWRVVEQEGKPIVEGQVPGQFNDLVGNEGWVMSEAGIYVVSGIMGVTLQIPNAGTDVIAIQLNRFIERVTGGIGTT
jgi:hypothetical protein